MDLMTVEQFKTALPAQMRKSVNKEVLDQINTKLSDVDMHETYRENLLSYAHIMREGKYKVSQYIDAIKYVSLKVMGKTNIEAYSITFPDKIVDWRNRGTTDKDVSAYVASYNKGKLISRLLEETAIPIWILNQSTQQKAINILLDLAVNANSEKVRSDSASSLLTHLKPPETTKVELDIGIKGESVISGLKKTISDLGSVQSEAIGLGILNAQEVANQDIVVAEAEYEEVPNAQ